MRQVSTILNIKFTCICLTISLIPLAMIHKRFNNPKVYAVIVGISEYQDKQKNLSFADDDATLFYECLTKAMPFETQKGLVRLIKNEKATNNLIIGMLQKIFTTASKDDMIIFYFSGHGNKGYLTPHDNSNFLWYGDVIEIFANSSAKYKLLVLDACFSGSFLNNTSDKDLFSFMEDDFNARFAIICSSDPNQESLENHKLGKSGFTYFLAKGLTGAADANKDTYITLNELFNYTRERTAAFTNGRQVPMIYGKSMDKIPLARVSNFSSPFFNLKKTP